MTEAKGNLEDDIVNVGLEKEKHNRKIKSLKQDNLDIESSLKKRDDNIVKIRESTKEIEADIQNAKGDVAISQTAVDAMSNSDNVTARDFSKDREQLKEGLEITKKTVATDKESLKENISKVTRLKEALAEVTVKLSGSIECPKCSNEFVLDGDRDSLVIKQSKIIEMISKYEGISETMKTKVGESETVRDSISNKISELDQLEQDDLTASRKSAALLRGLKDTLSADEDKLSKVKKKLLKIDELVSDEEDAKVRISKGTAVNNEDIKKQESKLEKCDIEISEINDKIAKLKVGNNKNKITEIEVEIKGLLKDKLELEESEIKTLEVIKNRNEWATRFKQFRLHLANKSLGVMEHRTNAFLEQLQVDIRVKYYGYKTLAKGDVKEEISALIVRDAVERPFASLSGGEQVRVLFSSILANQYLINMTHPYGGLDFLGVDEVFDRIDGLGMMYLVRSAKPLNTPIMIISHVSDEEMSGEEILTIEKNHGVSTIKQQVK